MVILEQNNPPVYTYRGVGNKVNFRLSLDVDACITCFQCMDKCANDAFLDDGGDLVFLPNACDMNGNCADACPTQALVFVSPDDEAECLANTSEAQATAVSELISITPSISSTGVIERTYIWKIYKNLFNMWYFQSTEVASLKEVTRNGQKELQYIDVEHKSIDFVGFTAVISPEITAVPTRTIGTYTAVMELTGVFKLHLVCKELPSIFSTAFSTHMSWNVND